MSDILISFLLNLTLEQELLFSSGAVLSVVLILLRSSRKKTRETQEVKQAAASSSLGEGPEEITEKNYLEGLKQSRGFLLSKVTAWLTSNKTFNQKDALELEEILIAADLGVQTSQKIVKNVFAKLNQSSDLMSLLKDELIQILTSETSPEIDLNKHAPNIILIVGVNGAGKTTTIAKISKLFKAQGKRVLVAAADTFRAAAVGQLNHWANRIGVDIEFKEGENIKPATIVFDAVARLKNGKQDVLIIDTAGRLHNRVNLMNELEGIKKSIQRDFPNAPHETLLVLDGSSGQNALQQAREFNERVPLTGIVITKLDGTSKGGIVVAIKEELKIDIRYIGLGEGEGDLKPFNANEFVNALLGDGVIVNGAINKLDQFEPASGERKKVVRKR